VVVLLNKNTRLARCHCPFPISFILHT